MRDVPTFKLTDLDFDVSEFQGEWRREGAHVDLFLRGVHVLRTLPLGSIEMLVTVQDGRDVDPAAIVISQDEAETVLFRLNMALVRLARPESDGYWRSMELSKCLREAHNHLFRPGSFRRNLWPLGLASSTDAGARSVRDFPSGLPGLGKRR